MTWAPPWSVTSQLQSFAVARYPLTGSRVSLSASTREKGCIGKGQPRSQADRAGHESPGEDCGRPHQIVGVNRRFPVWLRPRQRHNRRNFCCQASAKEVSSCQQDTLHGFRRPGESFWSSTSEGHLVRAEKTVWRSGLYDWCRGCMQMRGAVSVLVRDTVKSLKWRSVFTKAQYSAHFSSSLWLKPYHESSALIVP